MKYYKKTIIATVKETGTSIKTGLKTGQVKAKQRKFGLNILKQEKGVSAWKVFVDQFKSFLILILIVAAVVSLFVGESVDAIVIIAIVVLNSILGFVQEYNAEKSIEALKKMSSARSKVIRNGKEILVDSKDLVLGDILVFEAGDKIGADARIMQTVSLETAEAALTGESLPVQKQINMIKGEVPLGDQKNMVFAGTTVTKGRGKAIVTAIGMHTEIGKIAGMIQEAPEKQTNLQKDLDKLSKRIGLAIIIICVVIFVTNISMGESGIQEAFLAAVALSVAAIPEGLPAVVTISLGLGVKRLVKKNALMRKLSSVETLGSVDIICTDKTGTLTKNEMTVKKLFVNNEIIEVGGVGYNMDGNFSKDSKKNILKQKDDIRYISGLLKIGVLCNGSEFDGKNIIGDPTEVALLVSAMKAGIDREHIEKLFKRKDEIPFDSDRKMMTTVRSGMPKNSICFDGNENDNLFLFTKGAPELLLDRCDRILLNGKIKRLTKKEKENILKHNKDFAQSALRVLGFAYKTCTQLEYDKKKNMENTGVEENLIFVGLQAMIDPPRPEVKQSIKSCHTAGIKVVMITGDNIITAKAIADELGIVGDAIEGMELEGLTDRKIKKMIESVGVFARVSPRHKRKIVRILKGMGHTVSMTGDGVNDAPALKYADIGVSMGITGTDVTKEASDMILMDDNFATIVTAIEEGRGIYDNIKKFVNYLFSTNFAEILIIFISTLVGLPLPLIAIQILWMNLVTDGFPALALGVDQASPGIMKRKPRKKGSKIVDRNMIINIIWLSIFMTGGSLYVFISNYNTDITQARTGVLVLLTMMELIRVWMIRNDYNLPFWSNKRMFIALGTSLSLVMAVVYIPFLANIFQTAPLIGEIWMDIVIILTVMVSVGIVTNWIKNRVKRWER